MSRSRKLAPTTEKKRQVKPYIRHRFSGPNDMYALDELER
jgi:hypothetical protein